MRILRSRHGKLLLPIIITLTTLLFSCEEAADDNAGFGNPPVPENCFCDPEGINTYLEWTAAEYPGLTELRIIGTSGSGRDILALEISDNPGITENEPAVLINGAIHGNEQIAAGIPLKMIEFLLQAYTDGNADAIYIVNSLKLHFIPAVNPDGLAGSARNNSNNVDLNRNFGYNWDAGQQFSGSAPFDQSESAAVRNDFLKYGYCLSLNLHTAGSMWNIGIYAPWDAFGTDETDFISEYLPNYPLIEGIGLSYTAAVKGTGIYPFEQYFHYQEGADWYAFNGSMSDWALGVYGTVSYSIELYGDQDFTVDDAGTLDKCWTAHKEAILNIVESAGAGSGGRVKDSSGLSVSEAVITLASADGGSRSFVPISYPALKGNTDSNGQFRLLTEAGTYNIVIEKPGFQMYEAEITVDGSGKTSIAGGNASMFPEYQLSE